MSIFGLNIEIKAEEKRAEVERSVGADYDNTMFEDSSVFFSEEALQDGRAQIERVSIGVPFISQGSSVKSNLLVKKTGAESSTSDKGLTTTRVSRERTLEEEKEAS